MFIILIKNPLVLVNSFRDAFERKLATRNNKWVFETDKREGIIDEIEKVKTEATEQSDTIMLTLIYNQEYLKDYVEILLSGL